ncbi:hypothetical protein LX97_00777 [Nonlabens dokdonensis]|jgi:hypothetical protein|uniref:Uncharacterized protein n=2 Tax=Nonlabens dokdonensis TaxID=328515 RepID=L7W7C1_NONDD|nr:hypothetical protein [Nonlabens dokdonensis]AGC76102.1 hypothetical protein DDD_0975 [Nonlabens dokdonensis DSW-6]PZX43773.1 hypothetical protein LX97_00777 [Nonlabens dokdonensis]
MNLAELIKYFKENRSKEEFFKNNHLNMESEVVEIYMQKPFSLNNKVKFLEIEKTKGTIEFDINNVKYYNLIDFYAFLDFIKDSMESSNDNLTDAQLAKILLDYCINDA